MMVGSVVAGRAWCRISARGAARARTELYLKSWMSASMRPVR